MIPKGLKVGDLYTVEGMTYRVTKVIGENYESVWVGNTSPMPLVTDKEEEKPDYVSMQYAALKKMCAEKGIDARGTKAELIERLTK